jgi:hypothetical protein
MSDKALARFMIDVVAAAELSAGRDRNHLRPQGRKAVGILQ